MTLPLRHHIHSPQQSTYLLFRTYSVFSTPLLPCRLVSVQFHSIFHGNYFLLSTAFFAASRLPAASTPVTLGNLWVAGGGAGWREEGCCGDSYRKQHEGVQCSLHPSLHPHPFPLRPHPHPPRRLFLLSVSFTFTSSSSRSPSSPLPPLLHSHRLTSLPPPPPPPFKPYHLSFFVSVRNKSLNSPFFLFLLFLFSLLVFVSLIRLSFFPQSFCCCCSPTLLSSSSFVLLLFIFSFSLLRSPS